MKPELTEEQLALWERVKAKILEEPEHFDISGVIYEHDSCGTTCCIGGWAYMLVHGHPNKIQPGRWDSQSVLIEAARLLGIPSLPDRAVGAPLFYFNSWPKEYRDRFAEARDLPSLKECLKEQSRVAVELIDAWIATGIAEPEKPES